MVELVNLKKASKPLKANLLCFHHAGGGVNAFREWGAVLPESLGLWALRLPGRENLYLKPAFQRLQDIIDAIDFDVLAPLFSLYDIPTLLLGHSMGGLIAFEVAKKFKASNIAALAISGLGHPLYTKKQARHLLADQELRKYINYENIVGNHYIDELLDLLLPTIRCDYEVCDTYVYKKAEKLTIPVLSFGGVDDQAHFPESLRYWGSETVSEYIRYLYPGGHFFIRSHYPELIKCLLRSRSIS